MSSLFNCIFVMNILFSFQLYFCYKHVILCPSFFSVVQKNVVAGAPRIGFTHPGEVCREAEPVVEGVSGWYGNEVRSAYIGLVIFKGTCNAEEK